MKIENIFLFLIAKMYDINFYQQLLATVCERNPKQFI